MPSTKQREGGTAYPIIPERLEQLAEATIEVGHGSEPPPEHGCAMDWTAYLCGLPHSDTPTCTDPRLARLVHAINDGIKDKAERTVQMRKLIPLLANTAGQEDEVGALLDRLAVWRLRNIVLPLADTWPESVREPCVSAVEGVCDAIENGGDRSAARSARSAKSAAWSGSASAWSVAWSVAYAAKSAESAASAKSAKSAESARSAESAAKSAAYAAYAAESVAESARSAWSVAESAAYAAESAALISELEAFHVARGITA